MEPCGGRNHSAVSRQQNQTRLMVHPGRRNTGRARECQQDTGNASRTHQAPVHPTLLAPLHPFPSAPAEQQAVSPTAMECPPGRGCRGVGYKPGVPQPLSSPGTVTCPQQAAGASRSRSSGTRHGGAVGSLLGPWGAGTIPAGGRSRGHGPLWAPSTATGIYCMCSYAPFLVQRFGISSELRETTAAAGLARDSSRAALDLWGSETLRKAERWSHIP